MIVTRDIAKSRDVSPCCSSITGRSFTEIGLRQIGTITAPLLEASNEAGESALGDVIADAMLEPTAAPHPAEPKSRCGIPAGFAPTSSGSRWRPGKLVTVIFSQAFDVLPFGNRVEVRTVSGAALIAMIETGIFQVSRGISYQVDPTRPRRQRVDPATSRSPAGH